MSNVLINRDLYDAEYVAANSVGFDEWASAIAGYTPEWAEGVTGIPAADIERLALEFAEAAPRPPSSRAGAVPSGARTRTRARRRALSACSTHFWAAGTSPAGRCSSPA